MNAECAEAIPSTTSICPACGHAPADGVSFTTCPQCGLIISKFLKRREQSLLNEENLPAAADDSAEPTVNRFKPGWVMIAGVLIVLIAAGVTAAHHLFSRQQQERAAGEQERAISFHRAIAKGEQDKVRRLLVTGVNPDIKVKNQTALETAIKNQEFEIAGLLLSNGASLAAMNRNGEALFLQLVNANNTAGALFLLRNGISANTSFPENHVVLMSAAAHGNRELVLALLEKGADVNAVGTDGTTPLISAAWNQHVEIMKLLVDRGAAISPRTARGYTPLKIAREKRNPAMIEFLEKAGALE
jgi:ankyrin repeat protein